jgi:hypothetical protein
VLPKINNQALLFLLQQILLNYISRRKPINCLLKCTQGVKARSGKLPTSILYIYILIEKKKSVLNGSLVIENNQ